MDPHRCPRTTTIAVRTLAGVLNLALFCACSGSPAGPSRDRVDLVGARPAPENIAQSGDLSASDPTSPTAAGPLAGATAVPVRPPVTLTETEPQEQICSDAMITPVVEGGGNLLVIFDRSNSMNLFFSGTQTRLQAVNDALNAAVTPFQCEVSGPDQDFCEEMLHVGAILFPSAAGGLAGLLGGLGGPPGGGGRCPVDAIDANTQINWQLATPFLGSWNAYWQGPNGQLMPGTPIPAAFAKAELALSNNPPAGTTTALFLTDGESNCDEGVDPIMQAQAWLARGIRTYVVSVAPGNNQFNDAVAQAGGTDVSLNPTDTQQLADTLQQVIDAAVQPISCTVDLMGQGIANQEAACEKGEVLLGPIPLACDPINGFQVRGPNTIEVVGDACTDLQSGKRRLSATFPCEVLLE